MQPHTSDSIAIVLGGGISGLTAARALQQAGQPFVLLERCPTLGGLTRTVEVGDYCFDYTGHFLHLSRYRTPANIPYAGLCDDDWASVARRSCCLVAGRFITAPIQYHLGELPPDLLAACVSSYEQRPAVSTAHASFRDYLVSGFGQMLADQVLIPQNEKTMAVDMDRLSRDAVRRFFPAPDDRLIRAGIEGSLPADQGYNALFWYPRQGGIGKLVHGLAQGVGPHTVYEGAVALDLERRTLRTSGGRTFRWNQLFSSIPLNDLCAISNEPFLRETGRTLSHSSTISFNIGLRGPLPPELHNIHWVYVPDRSIPFYRVGFYSNIGSGTAAAGTSSMYVEVGVTPDALDDLNMVGELQAEVLDALTGLGWLDPRHVVCTAVHQIRHAYVHHTDDRNSTVARIFERLAAGGIRPIGRYGQWDYTSMEDSIDSAINAVNEALACNTAS